VNKRYVYEAVFERDDVDGGYTVTFPDIDPIVTQGEDLEDAVREAAAALEFWIIGNILDENVVPKATYGNHVDDGYVIAISVCPRPAAEVIEYISTPEAARMLGVSDGRIRQMVASGQLPAKKEGRDNMVRFTDVEALRTKPRKAGRPKKEAAAG